MILAVPSPWRIGFCRCSTNQAPPDLNFAEQARLETPESHLRQDVPQQREAYGFINCWARRRLWASCVRKLSPISEASYTKGLSSSARSKEARAWQVWPLWGRSATARMKDERSATEATRVYSFDHPGCQNGNPGCRVFELRSWPRTNQLISLRDAWHEVPGNLE